MADFLKIGFPTVQIRMLTKRNIGLKYDSLIEDDIQIT